MANKQDLIKLVSEKTGVINEKNYPTVKETQIIIDAITEGIKELLIEDGKVQILGFGTFEKRERAERTGRNPQTGEEIKIPKTVVPAFKAGKALKDTVKPKNKVTKNAKK